MKPELMLNSLTPELKEKIYLRFREHALETVGIDGLEDAVVFELKDDHSLIGCIVVQPFWGQLHLKYIFVEKVYRAKGYGRLLVEHVCNYGQKHGCQFIFVETMSFQAPEFYEKLGFKVELKRDGYAVSTSFYYMRRDL